MMHRSLLITWMILALLITFSLPTRAYKVLLYHGANPPYSYHQQGQIKGIFADLFAGISKRTGISFEFEMHSVARGQRLFELNQIHIEPGINPIWRQHRKVPGIYTIPYAISSEVIVSKDNQVISSIEAQYGKTIGIVRGYRYGDFETHFGDEKLVVFEGRAEPDLLALLQKGRIDYAIMGAATAHYYIANYKQYRPLSVVYKVSELPVSLRIHPDNMYLKSRLDKALTEMIGNREIAQIYFKYTGNTSNVLLNK